MEPVEEGTTRLTSNWWFGGWQNFMINSIVSYYDQSEGGLHGMAEGDHGTGQCSHVPRPWPAHRTFKAFSCKTSSTINKIEASQRSNGDPFLLGLLHGLLLAHPLHRPLLR